MMFATGFIVGAIFGVVVIEGGAYLLMRWLMRND